MSLPTHSEFLDLVQIFRKERTTLPKWKSYPLYALFIMSIGILIAMIKMSSSRYEEIPEHPSNYRLVMKVNWLGFKSYEFHER